MTENDPIFGTLKQLDPVRSDLTEQESARAEALLAQLLNSGPASQTGAQRERPTRRTVLLGAAAASVAAISTYVLTRPEPPREAWASLSMAVDVTDLDEVARWSDAVFVASVGEVVGRARSHGIPGTQYRVEVLRALKGDLARQETINELVRFDGGDEPVEQGRTYLLAGRRTPRGLIMIVPIFGDEPVGGVDDPAVLRMERAVRASAATPSPVK